MIDNNAYNLFFSLRERLIEEKFFRELLVEKLSFPYLICILKKITIMRNDTFWKCFLISFSRKLFHEKR